MSVETGKKAEQAAAKFLKTKGFKIIDANWRTRWCEIDIVAQKNDAIYFVEVKYRAKDNWGGGLDYITDQKLKQMTFAAEFWVSKNKFNGDYCLSAIEVSGDQFKVSAWIDSL